MPPSLATSTHYALVIDAGSSGSRLQIYSWRDPDLERAEIVKEVRETFDQAIASGSSSPSSSSTLNDLNHNGESFKGKWWWPPAIGTSFWKSKGKGKGKEREREQEILLVLEEKALRRLVRVGKGVEGDEWVKRVEPGISTQTPPEIRNYLSPMLTHALQQIPPSQHQHTPIYLFATAGMRLLSRDAREAILEETCNVIRNEYPFLVGQPNQSGPCGENIRVISGEEEGMWGWVAVNYLMDGFGHAPPSSSSGGIDPATGYGHGHGLYSDSSSANGEGLLPLAPLAEPPPDSSSESVTPVDIHHQSPTFGFLDMGGASTQLAFSPTKSELLKSGFPEEQLETISLKLLSGEIVEWPVFAASWLGFGTNRVRQRYVENLVEMWKKSYTEIDPELLDLSTPISDPCLPLDLVIKSEDPNHHPDFIGTGSFSQCITDLLPLLGHSSPCPTSHCLFAGLPTPHIDFQREDQRGFIGISEYWYTAQQVLGLGGVWDWGEWEKGMGEFCSRDWQDIERQVEADKGWRGAAVELSRLQLQCFKGAWISNVLHEGIGIPRLMDAGGNDTLTGGDLGDTNAEAERRAREKGLFESTSRHKHHFQSMDEVGETAISWTLGKMVIEASKAVPPRSHIVENAWSKTLHGGIGEFEARLGELGIQAVWAYGVIILLIAACFFNSLFRRRYRSNTPNGRRGRKPSISGSGTSPISSNGNWCWPLTSRNSSDSMYSTYNLEDGIDLTPVKSRYTVGRTRIWALRLTSLLKRYLPLPHHSSTHERERPRIMTGVRHVSMPLSTLATPYTYRESGMTSPVGGPGGSMSQPNSPRSTSGFFVPASMLANDSHGHGSSTNLNGINTSSLGVSNSRGLSTPTSDSKFSLQSPINVSTSPPRGTKRPIRSRQNSSTAISSSYPHSHPHSHSNLLSPDPSMNSNSNGRNMVGGWNDPPNNMLSTTSTSTSTSSTLVGNTISNSHNQTPTGILTPTAGNGGLSATFYELPTHRALSRNSSRANLSDIGLNQRGSRAGTPFGDDIA